MNDVRNHSAVAPCPRCSGTNAAPVGYTWWGGVLGPKILSHVRCPDCKMQYNGKTGGSNTGGIILYSVVATIAVFVILTLLQVMTRR